MTGRDPPRPAALGALLAMASLWWVPAALAEEPRASRAAAAEADAPPPPRGWWARPLDRLALRALAVRDAPRPYDAPLRPRPLAGAVSAPCEHREGRPCGAGLGGFIELDASAGYGAAARASVRLRGTGGWDAYAPDLTLDRAFVAGAWRGIAAEVGRDALVVGPAGRTRLGYGAHAPPLDHARLATAAPVALGPHARLAALYVVGRPRGPQRFPGALLTISRLELGVGDALEVGALQLLQLGGEGAPPVGVLGFLAEHVGRRDSTAGATDSSNRRFGGDVALRLPDLRGLRLYYALVFEDVRRRWLTAVRHDADHLLGVELAAPGPRWLTGVTLEYHKTGARSHEHTPRTTGMTSGARVLGSPLGPDARALFLGGRLRWGGLALAPWLEGAHLASDDYTYEVGGPIRRDRAGARERRYRLGLVARRAVGRAAWVEAEGLVERVEDVGFERGARRTNGALSLALVWRPADR